MARLAALLGVAFVAACSGSDEPRNGELVASFENALYRVDPDDGARRAIPETEGAGEPAWSRDGSRLAFTRARVVRTTSFEAIVYDLYVIQPDGTEQRLVARNASGPGWSPDATRIAFTRDMCVRLSCPDTGNPNELFLVDVESGETRRLTTNRHYDGGPSWSPDGERIVFESEEGLSVIRPDGTDERRLTGEWIHWGPSWSPDGRLIVFADGVDVYVIGADGGEPERLTENDGPDFLPAWSPDGTKIAYISNHACARQGGCTAHEPMHVRIMNADGSESRALTDGGWGGPSWGPLRDED